MITAQAPRIVRRKKAAASPFFTPVRKAKAASSDAQPQTKENEQPDNNRVEEGEEEDEAMVQLRKSMNDRPKVQLSLKSEASRARFDDRLPLSPVREEPITEPPLTKPMDSNIFLLDKGGFDKWYGAVNELLLKNGYQSLAFPETTPPSLDKGYYAEKLKRFSYTNP